jgi:hypothetical protein
MEDLCTIFESENRCEKSIDENWTLFKETLLKSMEKNIPTKKITSRWNFRGLLQTSDDYLYE